MRRSLAVFLLPGMITLAACTPVQWQHASFGTAPTSGELNECERAAYLEAQRQAFFYQLYRPRVLVGRDGRFYPAPLGFEPGNTYFLERDLFDYCMRAKGFRLVPIRPADRPAT
ncbi:MAG TPA: hypothetical protein VF342_13670 [Alphaproteobacteria bacterium]